ncbi:MAG TPA: ABC transporter permease [Candidatus Acidoferrales bacterium]|nr:ABC transporter permease [Candidatus Acidoferrales bacterium]
MTWVARLFRKGKQDARLDSEVRFHVEQQIADNIAAGVNPAEARRRALAQFGGVEYVKEECREARGTHFIETLLQDIRYALRMLRKSPGFTAIAVLTLALGIGANTAIFSIADAVLLRPLPYNNANRLVVVWQSDAQHRTTGAWFDTYREFQEWRQYSHSFANLAAATWANRSETILDWSGNPQRVLSIPVTVDFFSMLGVQPARGRTFDSADLQNPCTVVLSDGFWHGVLGGQNIVGNTLTLNGQTCAVVGIMPKNFSFYPKQTQLWNLITPQSDYAKHPWKWQVGVFGLLNPGVSRASAEDELSALQEGIVHEAPPNSMPEKALPDILDLQFNFTWLAGRNLRTSIIVLLAAVAFVLLIACVNIAGLLLGRASERSKEFGIRAALGSSRFRTIRQLVTESMLLSGCGALLGTFAAIAAVRYLNAANPVELPPGNPVTIDWRILLFTAALAVVTGLLFGLFPAWKASRCDLNNLLKKNAPSSSRVNKLFVVAQVALSLILLAGAGLLIESLFHLTSTPLGFEPRNLLAGYIDFPGKAYPASAQRLNFYDKLEDNISALAGVKGVAFAPLSAYDGNPLAVEGRYVAPNARADDVCQQPASSNYFQVMDIPLLRGREFDSGDREKTLPVAIINEALAREYFPNEDPLGKRIKVGDSDNKDPWLTIVGIVGNVKSFTVFKEMGYAADPCVYLPLKQDGGDSVAILIRTAGNPGLLIPAVRSEFSKLDGTLPPPDLTTMNDWLAQFLTQPRFRTFLLSIFAAMALLLCAVGIYGVLGQSVAQRRHEIGIRMAVGAQPRDILRLIIWQGIVLTLAGIVIGIAGSLALARLIVNLLYDVGATDPLTFGLVAVLVIIVSLAACYIPARRAMRVDPMVALRYE